MKFFYNLGACMNVQGEHLYYCISLVIRLSVFPSKTVPKNLDPSYKTDLDL